MFRRTPQTVLAALSVVAVLALSGCGNESDAEGAADTAPTTAPASSSDAASPGATCDYPADGQEAAKPVDPPPSTPSESGQVAVTIGTNLGDLKATLDADKTPCTVNSFASLAEQGYFDDVVCHRMTTQGIYVLQCGDPTGSGAGGPGYSFDDELDGSETYGAGTLAMANAGPATNGSQFFIVYGDTQLNPAYTVFGTVDPDAVKLVEGVAAKGTDNSNGQGDGHPKEEVKITGVTVG